MFFLTQNAIEYTIRQLFKVAYPDSIKILSIDTDKDGLSSMVKLNSKKIVFNISDHNTIDRLFSGKLNLRDFPTADGLCTIPVILNSGKEFADIADNSLIVNADIISLSFIMLSRYEETIISERDELSNFEFKNSISCKYNFIEFPIMDEYAMILQSYLKLLFPSMKLEKTKAEVIPTHDIDEFYRYSFSFLGIRRIISDILLSTDFKSVLTSINLILLKLINKKNDPFIKSIERLHNLSKRLNLLSEFYFMAAAKSNYNSGYSVDDTLLKSIITKISSSNMTVGIHGGFGTRNNADLLKLEKAKLQRICINPILKGRQHYLHFDINKTYKTLEESGLEFDSTLGYNEQEGFRCGTCHEFKAWDFLNDCEMNLIERPLIVMDVTLWSSKKYSKSDALKTILKLHSRCKAVGGKFIILWHNSYVERKTDWFNQVYVKSLEIICQPDQPAIY